MKKNLDQAMRLYLHCEDVIGLNQLIKFTPKKIIEIGVGTSEGVHSLPYIINGASVILFEPHPGFYRDIVEKLGSFSNVRIYNKGIYKEKGTNKFYDQWAGTFLGDMYDYTPVKIQNKYELNESDVFYCEVDTIDSYDDGDVDMLCMDCESCEWFVLERLKSRPTVIQLETHSIYSKYHPFEFAKIKDWFTNNQYSVLANNESDCIYVKDDYLLELGKIELKIQKL